MNTAKHVCRFCGGTLEIVGDLSRYFAVSSDCRPFRRGSKLAICALCGGVQKPASMEWRDAVTEIYRDYALYAQSDTRQEQLSFDRFGNALPRSEAALASLVANIELPELGKFLDVGAGNGALSRGAGKVLPAWRRFAFEPNVRERDRLLETGIEDVYEGALSAQGGPYDAIGFFQVLEHIPDVEEFLTDIRRLCGSRSHIFIQVPNHVDNPFDLLIADHCNHFSPATFMHTLAKSGLATTRLDMKVVGGNITATAAPLSPTQGSSPEIDIDYSRSRSALEASLDWLARTIRHAEKLAAECEHFALFGTSIGGTWLSSELPGAVSLFVDEDRSRVNSRRFGIPVTAPEDVPQNTDVFVAIPGRTAQLVAQRLTRPGVRYHFTDEPVTVMSGQRA